MQSDGDEKMEKVLRWRLRQREAEGPSGWEPPPLGRQAAVQHIRVGCEVPSAAGGLTWVVPAASCGGAPPPVPIHLGEFPLLVGITGEGVWGQVADLQAGIVPQEVTERHPGKSRTWASRLQEGTLISFDQGQAEQPGDSTWGQMATRSQSEGTVPVLALPLSAE